MGSITQPSPIPWVETPCTRSTALSQKAGCNIYLKCDYLQPSGSFKSRGVGNLMAKAILRHGPSKPIHFYCSSGGNAGLACATAAMSLGRPATIVVPMSTSALMCDKLRALGVELLQIGVHWVEADTHLREQLLAKDENGVYVPPFDHPDIWEGNGSLIDEVEKQMIGNGGYDAVVCSVGGGGLFCGLMEGLNRHGRLDGANKRGKGVKVLAMETEGTCSLASSLKEGKLVRLPGITGIATSLGAAQVAEKAFEWAQRPEVTSCVFTDAEAAMGSIAFADDERILVEAACGVSMAPAYNNTLKKELFPEDTDEEFQQRNVVLVVCGGSNVTLSVLEAYRHNYAGDEEMLSRWGK